MSKILDFAKTVGGVLGVLAIMGGMFYLSNLKSCNGDNDDSQSNEPPEINPRKEVLTHEFYGDSVYIVSKNIDTVYFIRDWVKDFRKVKEKERRAAGSPPR